MVAFVLGFSTLRVLGLWSFEDLGLESFEVRVLGLRVVGFRDSWVLVFQTLLTASLFAVRHVLSRAMQTKPKGPLGGGGVGV